MRTSDATVQQSQRQLEAAQAQVAQADANNTKAQLDLKRYTPLVEKDVISKQQFDATVATADASRAALLGAKASEIAAEDAVRIARDRVVQSQAELTTAQTAPDQVKIQKAKADQAAAQVEQARAELAQAKLNLGYTRIVAPVNGIITKKSLEVAAERQRRPEPDDPGLAGRYLDHGKLQGDATAADASRDSRSRSTWTPTDVTMTVR